MNTSVQYFFDSLQSARSVRYISILAGIIIVVIAGWGGYYYFTQKKAQEAQKAFSESLAEFDKAAQEPEEARWDDVVRAFQTAYDRYSGTWAGPFLLAYKSQALIQQGKPDEAIADMTKAASMLKKSSPLYYFYATKAALMKMDSNNDAIRSTGIKELESLSENAKNPDRERALYYLGLYASKHGDQKRAAALWSTLIQRASPDSVWVPAAKKKLAAVHKVM